MPSKPVLRETNNTLVLGNYVVAIDGKPFAHFQTAEQATLYLTRNPGRARVYSPEGRILVTRGEVVRD